MSISARGESVTIERLKVFNGLQYATLLAKITEVCLIDGPPQPQLFPKEQVKLLKLQTNDKKPRI